MLSEYLFTATGAHAPIYRTVDEEWIRPVLFGYAIGQTVSDGMRSSHVDTSQRFTNAPWSSRRVGPPWHFGFISSQVPSGLYLYDHDSFTAPPEQ